MMTNDFPMFTEPQSYPFSMPQPFLQNFTQPVDFPVPQTFQPVIVPAPVGVPIPQPYGIPFDRPVPLPYFQPVAVPVDRPCAVPMPVGVPVPQPYAVPQPVVIREQVGVPVPMPVPVPVAAPQQNFYSPPVVREVERIIEEPIRIKRCRRRRRRYRSCTPSPPPPLAPIIITVPIQVPAPAQPTYQVTEYVQDIYPPAQVFSEQVPVGYVEKNKVVQEPQRIIRQQTTVNCQPGVVIPTGPVSSSSSSLIQQRLPSGQIIQRPLSVGGSTGFQTMMLPASNSGPVQTRIIQ